MSQVPAWKKTAYDAVRQAGVLTPSAEINALIWRAVECALNDTEIGLRRLDPESSDSGEANRG